MSLNNGLHSLYSSTDLIKKYRQVFNYNQGLSTDSAYINYIEETASTIIIKFPEPINLITNIIVPSSHAKYKMVSDSGPISKNTDVFLTKKYKNLRLVIYDIKEYSNLVFEYDVYLFKKKLLSAL